jgi:Ca2+-binding RTX toxin-like protein
MAKLKLTGDEQMGFYTFSVAPFWAISSPVYNTEDIAIVNIGGANFLFGGSGFTSFDAHGYATSGTVTSFELLIGFASFKITDFSESASDIQHIFKTGDTEGFQDLLLGGNDTITTNQGGGTVGGFGGNDTMRGLVGDDGLYGGNGNDKLKAGAGTDFLSGGRGTDTLTGGDDIDTFYFGEVADSRKGGIDTIRDLADTDVIDLSDIDADDGTVADDDFTLVTAFSDTAGELVVTFNGGQNRTTIKGDVDGDGKADLTIYASGNVEDFENFLL